MIILAAVRDDLRATCLSALHAEGWSARAAADMAGLAAQVLDPAATLVLVDPELPALDPELLARLAALAPHRPVVRVLGEGRPPLPRVPVTPPALLRLARRYAGVTVPAADARRVLRWMGLGDRPLGVLASLAESPLPVLFVGERGTGKERLAHLTHTLSGRPGALQAVEPDQPVPRGRGSVYLVNADRRPALREDVRALRADGAGIFAGAREGRPPGGVEWRELRVPPLRERADDLRGLAQHYLDEATRRMGLPHRTFDRPLWSAIAAWRWPRNHRELEEFVVAALAAVDRPVIRARELPPGVAARLVQRDEGLEHQLESFEAVAEARLAPVVKAYAPGGEETLWELVTGATTRVLLRLALERTGGNRKAAAALLGVARNTFAAALERHGLRGGSAG